MWMRRMRDIQRTRFSETFPSTNKCVSCSHLAIFNRFIFEGSSSHSFWTFLGTSSIESNGTRVPFRVWGVNFHTIFWLINSFNICSMFNFVSHLFGRNYFIFRAIILRIGNARTDAKFCHILAGSRSHVLGIGDNVKLQSLWRQLGAWRTTNLGSTQACH